MTALLRMHTTSWLLTRSVMEARLQYSRSLLLMAPTTNPLPAPVAPGIPDALPAAAADAERAFTWQNTDAIVVLALLICGLVAAIALYVVLQCALRVTARAWYGAGAALQEPAPRARGGRHNGGGSRKRGAMVHALPCVAYSAGLELAGSSRWECAICLAQFARGQQVRVLPRCSHGFHARCIDRWLVARPTCPTCRQAPFAEAEHVQADCARPAVVAVVRVTVDGGAGRHVESLSARDGRLIVQ